MEKFLLPFLYFFLSPLFFLKKEFIWSKFLIFSFSNILFLTWYLVKYKRANGISYSFIIWAIFTTFSSLSFFHAVDSYRSITLIGIYFSLLTFLFIIEKLPIDERLCSVFLSLSSAVVSIIGIMQSFGILMKPYYTKYGEIDISSTFGLSNFSAEYIAVASGFSYFLLKDGKKFYPLTIASLILGASYIILAGAMAGFLGFLSGFFSYIIFNHRKKFLKAFPFLMLFLLLLFLLTPAKNFIKRGERILKMDDAPSLFRIECWKSALKIFKDHPFFGVGAGNFEVYVEKYGSERLEGLTDSLNVKTKRAHNDFLDVLSEEGFFGFSLFLLFFAIAFYNSLKNKNYKFLPPFVAYSVISLFSFPIRIIPTVGAFFLSVSLSSSDLKSKRKSIFEIPIFLFTIFFSFFGLRVFEEEYLRRQAIVQTLKGNLPQALFFINRAIEKNPYESDLYFLRAQIYYKMKREFPSAIEDLKKFVKRNPYHGKAYYILSLLEFYLMRYKESAEHMDKAFEWKKLKDKNFYFYAYKIYASAGLEDKALNSLILYKTIP